MWLTLAWNCAESQGSVRCREDLLTPQQRKETWGSFFVQHFTLWRLGTILPCHGVISKKCTKKKVDTSFGWRKWKQIQAAKLSPFAPSSEPPVPFTETFGPWRHQHDINKSCGYDEVAARIGRLLASSKICRGCHLPFDPFQGSPTTGFCRRICRTRILRSR